MQGASRSEIRLCAVCGTRVAETALRCIVCGADLAATARKRTRDAHTSEVQAAQLAPPPPPPPAPSIGNGAPAPLPLELPDSLSNSPVSRLARIPRPVLASIAVAAAAILGLLGLAAVLLSTGAASAVPLATEQPSATAPATFTPPPPPTATPLATRTPLPPLTHIVAEGDSCTRLAVLYGVTLESILRLNGLAQSCTIQVGQEIYIPQPTPTPDPFGRTAAPGGAAGPRPPHIVEAGESLHSIADFYGVDAGQLAAMNELEPPDYVLQIGQELLIPPAGQRP